MIDLSIYEFLEKIVEEQRPILKEFQALYKCEDNEIKLGINSLQSIIRSSVIEEQQDDTTYLRIEYGKKGLESRKLGNLRFDLEHIISLLSNVPGILAKEKWAIFMTVLKLISELKRTKVELSPAMGIIVLYLHENGYIKRNHRMIKEEDLKENISNDFLAYFQIQDFEKEFYSAINSLIQLNSIILMDGEISLLEEVRI